MAEKMVIKKEKRNVHDPRNMLIDIAECAK